MAVSRTRPRLVARGRRSLFPANWLLVPAFLIGAAAGGVLLGSAPELGLSRLIDEPAPSASALTARVFPICAGGTRVTCVVDGDTFWLDGIKIRIADINTPEVSAPACAAEAALGRQATTRLRELLSAGPFALERIDRDEDVYGRKLRIVSRDGRSIGAVLVAEGLAHPWQGYRESWC